MVVNVITDEGDRLVDLDDLMLFGFIPECDAETIRLKYGDKEVEDDKRSSSKT